MISHRPREKINRLKVVMILSLFVATIIGLRLMYLQVFKGNYYQTLATKEHLGYTELTPRRGEIFLQDYHSKEIFKIATNTTLDTIYADPTLIKNPQLVAEKLSDLIIDIKEEKIKDKARIEKEEKNLDPNLKPEEKEKLLKPLTDEELKQNFYTDLLEKLSSRTRQKIIIATDLDAEISEKISRENLTGIEIIGASLIAYPLQINNISKTAEVLAQHLNASSDNLASILKGKNRYVILKKKANPELSAKIKEIKKNDKNKDFAGIGLQSEYYRYYPEGMLASTITGYLNTQGIGQYGIEEKLDVLLRGQKGVFKMQKDSMGRQITVGESVIKPAVDGNDVVLTIDRSIQMEAERLAERGAKDYNADSGEIIVMEPSTGKVLAMARYPKFNPNVYWEAYNQQIINLKEDEIKNLVPIEGKESTFWLYLDKDTGRRIQIFKETHPNSATTYKKYANTIGPGVYQNKSVSESYEPGSVFKTIAVGAALDDGDITPNTTYFDSGPIKVDIYEIKNATDQYFGVVNMTTVLEKSLNTGMAFIAKKIGRTLFYSYIKKFGFSERTDIEFSNEDPGRVEHFSHWAESELITRAFGQGLMVTPLQMLNAYAAIANKGTRMKPYIVEKIIKKTGQTIINEPHPINQVISEKTAQTLSAMLIGAVENGVARNAQVPGYYLAGKTGTAQTYFKGKPLRGAGTTITTIAGFGPAKNPRFAILVKFDKPRSSEWADITAAPTFSKMAQFLFNYFNIPKDKK